MRITSLDVEPITEVAYQQARSGGGTQAARLRVDRLKVDRLPVGCDALLVTGDLQGVARSPWGGEPILLGIALADCLGVWAQEGLIPPPQRMGVVLTGDLYSAPGADRRGASGEVRDVWLAFAAAGCRFVLGVAGNHDVVSKEDLADLGPDVALLDGECVDQGGVVFGGVSWIIGDPGRTGRRDERTQLELVDTVLGQGPSVLVLHEGPPGRRTGQRGRAELGARIEQQAPPLTVCGHVHWDRMISALGTGHVLNVDGRAAVLRTAASRTDVTSPVAISE